MRSVAADERGIGLIDVLVTMIVGLLIFTAATTVMIDGLHKQVALQNRVGQLEQAQGVMQRLVRELREATSVSFSNPSGSSYSSVTYTDPTPGGSGTTSVTFTCTSSTQTCTRTAGGTTLTIIAPGTKSQLPGVSNSDVFTPSPSSSSPTSVSIKMTVTETGRQSVTITDEAGLRNITLGT